MDRSGRLERENAALRERLAQLGAAVLRVRSSLDLDTVLREAVDSARALTGARYGMIATVDEAGAIEEFIAPGLTDGERRHMAEWPPGEAFFEHLCALPGPLRATDLPACLRGLGFAGEFALSKTLQATPMRHPRRPCRAFLPRRQGAGPGLHREGRGGAGAVRCAGRGAIANARAHRDERRARADLEALVDTSPVGVAVFDAGSGRPQSFNREARRLVDSLRTPGQSPEGLLEVLTVRRADGREIALDASPLAEALRGGETVRAEEVELSVPDGRRLTVLINATPNRVSAAWDGAHVAVTVADEGRAWRRSGWGSCSASASGTTARSGRRVSGLRSARGWWRRMAGASGRRAAGPARGCGSPSPCRWRPTGATRPSRGRWRRARPTTSSSRSRRPSWWPASGPRCAGRPIPSHTGWANSRSTTRSAGCAWRGAR